MRVTFPRKIQTYVNEFGGTSEGRNQVEGMVGMLLCTPL